MAANHCEVAGGGHIAPVRLRSSFAVRVPHIIAVGDFWLYALGQLGGMHQQCVSSM